MSICAASCWQYGDGTYWLRTRRNIHKPTFLLANQAYESTLGTMNQTDKGMVSRVTLLLLQLLLLFVLGGSVSVAQLARDDMAVGTAVLVLSVLTLSVPASMWNGRWNITIPILANCLLLVGATYQAGAMHPPFYLGYMLLMLMAAHSPSMMQTVSLSSLLCSAYALSLYQLGALHSQHVLLIPTMAAMALVSVTNTRLITAKEERTTAFEEKVRSEAMSDELTGMPNRAQYIERVWRAIERAQNNKCFVFAVLFIDLDGFKPINDQFGHKAGDAVLKTVGKRLQGCLRKGDLAARYGGDEFVLLVHNVLGEIDAVRVAERVLRKLQDPIDVGRPVSVGASIGIALSTNIHARPEDLIKDADAAMYAAKAKGKNCYQFCNQLRTVLS